MEIKKKKAKTSDKIDKENIEIITLKEPTSLQVKLAKNFPFLLKGMAKKTNINQINLILAKKSLTNQLPKVNLIPAEVTLRVIYRRTKFTIALTALAAILIIASTWVIQGIGINSANNSYLNAQKLVALSQNKVNQLAPIQKYFDTLKARIDLTNNKIGRRIDYTKLLNSVNNALNGSAQISNIAIHLIAQSADKSKTGATASLASQCGNNNAPFSPDLVPLIACISFTGTANDRGRIATMINQLNAVSFLGNVNIDQASINTVGATSFTFTGTSTINNKILLPDTGTIK